jgi:predicted aspartyl protease
MPSFTTQVPNLQQTGPIVEIKIAVGSVIEEVLQKNNKNIPTPISTVAMVDTGATCTVIQENTAKSLNLNPVGVTLINTPSSTNVQCYEYLIRLLFPNNVIVETIAIAVPLQDQHIQCLIGRDVLRHGVLIYTGYINTFTLSF